MTRSPVRIVTERLLVMAGVSDSALEDDCGGGGSGQQVEREHRDC